MHHAATRSLFLLSVLWGASIFWIAPRPPMADLPQHAGQVALLHDLITGTSPWAEVFRINLLTPYLVGYGLALPLSFILPVGAALKVILSLAYVAFVAALVNLRRHFNADARLDWFFLLSFFGLSHYWGFLTFLVAAPVMVVFILVADRYAQQPTFRRGIATMLMGLALLLSHGLMFVFGLAVAGLLYTVRCRESQRWTERWLRGLWPLAISALACLAYFFFSQKLQQAYGGISNAGPPVMWHLSWKRPLKIFIDSLTGKTTATVLAAAFILPLIPWMLGLRINRHHPATWVLFGVALLIALTGPIFAMATGLLYIRFGLFMFPAYALLFTSEPPAAGTRAGAGRAGSGWAQRLAMPLMIALTWLMLGQHSWQAWRFAREAKDFEPILAAMEPARRALYLPFAQRSEAANNDVAYLHFALWYQAEKQGLVDFNFAWFPPQLARFRPEQLPAVSYGFEHSPGDFDWRKHRGERYHYVVARHTAPLPRGLFNGADCAPVQLLTSGAWTLFERGNCPAAALPLASR